VEKTSDTTVAWTIVSFLVFGAVVKLLLFEVLKKKNYSNSEVLMLLVEELICRFHSVSSILMLLQFLHSTLMYLPR